MKAFELFSEDILDDLVADFPDTDEPEHPPTIKTTPRKRYDPRVVHKGKPPEGFKRYVRNLEIKTVSLDKIIDMFVNKNIAFADNVILNVPVQDLHNVREYDREMIDGFTGKNTTEEMAEMEADIKKNGITSPGVVTLRRDKNGTVTAIMGEGNHRLSIAKKLGIETMPVRIYYKELFR